MYSGVCVGPELKIYASERSFLFVALCAGRALIVAGAPPTTHSDTYSRAGTPLGACCRVLLVLRTAKSAICDSFNVLQMKKSVEVEGRCNTNE